MFFEDSWQAVTGDVSEAAPLPPQLGAPKGLVLLQR